MKNDYFRIYIIRIFQLIIHTVIFWFYKIYIQTTTFNFGNEWFNKLNGIKILNLIGRATI